MVTLEDAILILEDGWPQRFTVEQAGVYLEALDDLEPQAVRDAVIRLLRVDEFRPSVARIRREVAAASAPSVEQALAQAEQVMRYREARRYVNGSGFDPEPPDVDPRVIAVLRSVPKTFGWQEKFVTLWRRQAWEDS